MSSLSVPTQPADTLAAEISDTEIQDLLAEVHTATQVLGLSVDLDLPPEQLWQQADLHEQGTAVHFISRGFYLLKLQAITPHGEWYTELEKRDLKPRRVLEAIRVVQWLLEANRRKCAGAENMLQTSPRKLIEMSRIPLNDIDNMGFSLDKLSTTNFTELQAEITALKQRLKKAENANANLAQQHEKTARKALRATLQAYSDFIEAVMSLAGLAPDLHGNARTGLVRRITHLHEEIQKEVRTLAKSRLKPAMERLQ